MNMSYYGLLFGADDLIGDTFVNNLVGGLVEMAAYFLCFITLITGRKRIYIAACLIAGFTLIATAFIDMFASGNLGYSPFFKYFKRSFSNVVSSKFSYGFKMLSWL